MTPPEPLSAPSLPQPVQDALQRGNLVEAIQLMRAGTPLLEIVTEPDMRSSAEAVAYAKELHKIVTWLGIKIGRAHV